MATEPSYSFVIEELETSIRSKVTVRPMFGSYAVYIDEKIVFILREKLDPKTIRDDGLWVATTQDHNDSLKKDFPCLRPIELFSKRGKKGFTGWLNLPKSTPDFEKLALEICSLVSSNDKRIGKYPKSSSTSKPLITKRRKRRRL